MHFLMTLQKPDAELHPRLPFPQLRTACDCVMVNFASSSTLSGGSYGHGPRRERKPLAKAVMDRARDFKMDKGFFVPIHFGDRASGSVSLAGERPEFEPGVKPALHLMSLYAHSRIRSFIEGSEPLPPVLTAREREVLQWTAAGKSS